MTSLTPDFQFLLSWCWINLKESCSCLGEVTGIVVSNSEQQKFPLQLLCNIGQTLVKVLTTCRHRGAIEGCRSGFYLFCSSLLSNNEKRLNDIPRAILRKILASLLENSMSSSVTRRSAGLPIIIQTVVQAARKCGDTGLLLSTVDYLYTIASKQFPNDWSQQHDLSQSHALNILKVIFCDASLAPALMPLLSKMTILVVEGFESPSWAIRNAATQLISTLVTRIFGQRNQLESGSSMTLEEFSSLYPELIQFVLDKLQSHRKSNIAVRPSLYIILTLMSGIGMSPSYQHTSSLREPLQHAVVSFLSNPVYSLRKLSARAHTSLIPSDRADESFQQILRKIQLRGSTKNELHGWLICALNLLSSGYLSSEMNFIVAKFVMDNCWLLEICPCLLVPSTVIEMTLLAVKQTPIDLRLLAKLWSAVKTLFSVVSSSMEKFHVGSDHCMDVCMKMMTAIYQSSEEARTVYHSQLCQLYSECLVSPLNGLRSTVLDLVKEEGDSFIKDEEIQKNVWMIISHDDNRTNVTKAVDVMLSATLNGDLHIHDITLTVKKLSHCQGDISSNFVVESIKFHFADDMQFIERACDLEEWCAHLVIFTSPSHNEDLRHLAAQCISVAGGNILQFCCRHKNLPGVEQAVTCLIKASLQLLEDTETEVRRTVSRFVTHLSCQARLHYTTSYYILSEFIVHNLSWCEATIYTLLNMVYVPGKLCQAISSVQISRLQQLFEPETSSPYSEVHMTQLWAYKTIEVKRNLVQSEFLVKQLNVMMSATLMELVSQMKVIQENVMSQPIFNMTCDGKVMSAILGIHLISQLYKSCRIHSSPISSDGETLQELVIKLQQSPSLHPFLRRNQFDCAQVRPSILDQFQHF
ncbi:unnamed protein product [Lymnaea stagnalis]|uniref:DUF2428 domain-containing protein n=1 Tax=Lymnaea stagnalis TaxID=6523 RepID=A0AAV2H0I0_LYMST